MRFVKQILFFLSLASLGCNSPQVNTYSEYLKWLGSPENGLVQSKFINGIEVKVKFMPAEFLTYRELKSEREYTAHQRDSLKGIYSNSLCFVLCIGPDQRTEDGGDIMFRSLKSYEAYKDRVYDMNFLMEEHVQLKAGDKEMRPVLTQMENTYEASVSRNIVLVFAPKEKGDNSLNKSDVLELKYSDEQFGIGTNYFQFKREDITKIPEINFWNTKG